jgi:protein-tyrosine phosphatase
MKILFVCLGNICRSPIAEGVLQHLIETMPLDWQTDSAGTEFFHVGGEPHQFSQQVCRENGIDISQQKARQFTRQDMDRFDKIYVMATDVYKNLREIAGDSFDAYKVDFFLNELYPGENRSVTDPWYGGLEGYYPVYDEIRKGCEAIVKKYQN